MAKAQKAFDPFHDRYHRTRVDGWIIGLTGRHWVRRLGIDYHTACGVAVSAFRDPLDDDGGVPCQVCKEIHAAETATAPAGS